MLVSQLQTPALLVDLDILERNQEKMQALANSLGVALRPHYKSHKCTYFAHMQMAAGAKGITCAKLSEAEDLIEAGIENVLIANQIVEPGKLMKLAQLAACCYLTVCVDNQENIDALEQAACAFDSTIHCLIEYEIGMGRCGVDTPEQVLHLAQRIQEHPHLVFEGIQAYAGNLAHETDFATRQSKSQEVEVRLQQLLAYLNAHGVTVKEVSGTSTGTVQFRQPGTVYTELQPGSYLFMDTAYGVFLETFAHSLFMLTTVVHTEAGKIICDAGMKSLSTDQGTPWLEADPKAPVEMSEEHSTFCTDAAAAVGDKLRLIPNHCCTTINLNSFLYLTRQGKVVDKIPITSRGKSL